MRFTKFFTILAFSLAIGILGCSTDKKVEAPKQQGVEKNLVPAKAELKGPNFTVELTDLKVAMVVDTASKEITETPNLRGRIKITNISKDVLDIQGVTLEYMDAAGKPIGFTSGEKIAKVYPFWKAVKPGEITEGSLDVTIPRMAVKEKALEKIEINLVYVPSPLKRETLTLDGKVEESVMGGYQRQGHFGPAMFERSALSPNLLEGFMKRKLLMVPIGSLQRGK